MQWSLPCFTAVLLSAALRAQAGVIEISSVRELAEYAAGSGNTVRMRPGVYRMADYLTDAVAVSIMADVPEGPGRPPVWMIRFSGNDNRFDLTGVTIEIDTGLYKKVPGGYQHSLFMPGTAPF